MTMIKNNKELRDRAVSIRMRAADLPLSDQRVCELIEDFADAVIDWMDGEEDFEQRDPIIQKILEESPYSICMLDGRAAEMEKTADSTIYRHNEPWMYNEATIDELKWLLSQLESK